MAIINELIRDRIYKRHKSSALTLEDATVHWDEEYVFSSHEGVCGASGRFAIATHYEVISCSSFNNDT